MFRTLLPIPRGPDAEDWTLSYGHDGDGTLTIEVFARRAADVALDVEPVNRISITKVEGFTLPYAET